MNRSAGKKFRQLGHRSALTDRQLAETYFGTTPGMEAFGTVMRVGSQVADTTPGDVMMISVRNILRR